MAKVVKTESEWRQSLDLEQYRILREKGTEAPFSGEYDHVFEPGTYPARGAAPSSSDPMRSTIPAVAGRPSSRLPPTTQSRRRPT